jgi:hypothetical protein
VLDKGSRDQFYYPVRGWLDKHRRFVKRTDESEQISCENPPPEQAPLYFEFAIFLRQKRGCSNLLKDEY